MSQRHASPLPDLIHSLEGKVEGEFRSDSVTRLLYSTDASIYKIKPMGVFFPAHSDDLAACVEAADQHGIPILARGSGSSLAGQAVGPGLIIDCSKHLNRVIKIDPVQKFARVEPGVILSHLNNIVANHNLQFGPDPASAEQATIGGVVANNATGAHSIRYGMTADNLVSLDLVLSDGSLSKFGNLEITEVQRRANEDARQGEIYRSILTIRSIYFDEIIKNWPRTWRRASGYNLNYLLPWSPSAPQQWSQSPGQETAEYPPPGGSKINLAALIAGSEGTLGIIREATLRLVPKPKYSALAILTYPSVSSACDAVSEILEFNPSAVEFIPANMIVLARDVPAYAHQVDFINDLVDLERRIPNLLVVEFNGDDWLQVKKFAEGATRINSSPSLLVVDQKSQQEIWNVRKVGLGLLMSKPGDFKPIPFIEDASIPVERLSEFVREIEDLLGSFNTRGDFYAHASVGCLHIRPLVNLKSIRGVSEMREIASEAMKIISRLGGVPSGEHGDGLSRSEWLKQVFGAEIYQAFQDLKNAADPKNILNPGKIVDSPRMNENLRYRTGALTVPWKTSLDFSNQGDLVGAVELCNGAGVCRKQDGVMCPSFQVTSEEMHSTRGRANLLGELFSGELNLMDKLDQDVVFSALDLCLACKGCKAECPSAVDMAKLKYEFLHWYYHHGGNRHSFRDYLFAYIGGIAQFGARFRNAANYLLEKGNGSELGERGLGISGKRQLPVLAERPLHAAMRKYREEISSTPTYEKVLFLSDPFTEYFQPGIGLSAVTAMINAGCEVELIPSIGSGRTLITKGFLKSARAHAQKVIREVIDLDPHKEAFIVGTEPSEIFTLRDEYLDLFPAELDAESIASRTLMIDEFLIRPGKENKTRLLRIVDKQNFRSMNDKHVLLHGHCYQKAQPPQEDGYPTGVYATIRMLESVGYNVELIDAGCCGMAGAFGYEIEHYDLSMAIGELSLFPKVRNADDEVIIAATGFSCLSQIKDGTGREAMHPIELLRTE